MTTPMNLFADLPAHLPAELFTTLLDAADVRIERIVSHGHASPADFWYGQPQHEWVTVLMLAEAGSETSELGSWLRPAAGSDADWQVALWAVAGHHPAYGRPSPPRFANTWNELGTRRWPSRTTGPPGSITWSAAAPR